MFDKFTAITDWFSSDDPLDAKFSKGDKNSLINDLKSYMNLIASYRNLDSLEFNGVQIHFPLEISDHLDDQTDAACHQIFPKYKSEAKISINQSRERLAYAAGYYGKEFPKLLEGLANLKTLQREFGRGSKDKLETGEEDFSIWDITRPDKFFDKALDYFDGDPNHNQFSKDDSDELIEKIQSGLNEMAQLKELKFLEVYAVKFDFPLQLTGVMDSETDLACLHFLPKYKTTGSISVKDTRERLAYLAGFSNKAFPISLVKVKNVDDFKKLYDLGVDFLNKASAEDLKAKLLNEILVAYEALGAKSIKIEEKSTINASLNSTVTLKAKEEKESKEKKEAKEENSVVSVESNFGSENRALTLKRFGKGVFDPERALKNAVLIQELPNVMRIIQARVHGNQTYERFEEIINLSAGVKASSIGNSLDVKASYNQSWLFEIEFHDKIENIYSNI